MLNQIVALLIVNTKCMIPGRRADAHLVYPAGIAYPLVVEMPKQKDICFAVYHFDYQLARTSVKLSGDIPSACILFLHHSFP